MKTIFDDKHFKIENGVKVGLTISDLEPIANMYRRQLRENKCDPRGNMAQVREALAAVEYDIALLIGK